tara:strand:- start:1838 stop:2077 length:240 start_codon:yes stop_codon:yes gene_type:complete
MKDARIAGGIAKRGGLAKKSIELIEGFDGSYKGAMRLAGELSVIADMATFDAYWEEQVIRGSIKTEDWLKSILDDGELK